MKLTWVNSAFVKAPGWVLGPDRLKSVWLPVRYGILEYGGCPIIVDAGYAPSLYEVSAGLPLRLYRQAMSIRFEQADPVKVLAKMGYDISDVKVVLLSHLHADHIGYLDRFKNAKFHVSRAAFEARHQWRKGCFEELLPFDFKDRVVLHDPKLGHVVFPGIEMVDLPGHAPGQVGFVFKDLKVFYAADAAWSYDSLGYLPLPARLISESRCVYESARLVKQRENEGLEIVLCHTP